MKTPSLFKKNTFTPKKVKPRRAQSLSNLATLDASERAQELGLQYGSASLKLNGTQLKFEDGYWTSEGTGGVPHQEFMKLRKENQRLLEENNMLKLKFDILLDMLSESTAECNILEKERNEALKSRH